MPLSYKTVKETFVSEYTEKKSRFIGCIAPVDSEKGAVEFINYLQSKYKDARHQPFAFNLKDGMTRRYSDDKEPTGTAGIPILDIILKENLKDVCVVVTRYFGGTLLGAGGLVRAYSTATSLAVKGALVVTMDTYICVYIKTTYNIFYKIKPTFNKYRLKVKSILYEQDITVNLLVNYCDVLNFKVDIINISNGKVEIVEKEKTFTCI